VTGGETGTDRQAGKPGTGAGKETSRGTGGETGTDRQAGKPGTGAGKETSREQVAIRLEERPGGGLTDN
jgi:hypothetical protein